MHILLRPFIELSTHPALDTGHPKVSQITPTRADGEAQVWGTQQKPGEPEDFLEEGASKQKGNGGKRWVRGRKERFQAGETACAVT